MSFPRFLRDKRVLIAAAAVALFAAAHYSGLSGYLSLDTLRAHRAELTAFVEQNFLAAAAIYVLIYVAAVAFSFPGAVFLTLSGGFLFGAVAGTGLTVVGATIGATLVFIFARAIFGEDALDKFGAPAKTLAANIRKNAWSYLLVLRLVPLFPFFLVNLIPAFVGVKLRTFALTTLFGIIPGTFVFSLSGAGLGSVLDKGGEFSPASILTPEIIAALCGLALLSLAAIPLRKRFASQETA